MIKNLLIFAENSCRSELGGYCLRISETHSNLTKTVNTGFAQVPGLEFLKLPADASIGDILIQLYVFGIGLVGVSALLVLVSAGIGYMTSGDNQTRLGQAKTWMGNAIFGLVLAIISYLILYTINPSLTSTLDLKLEKLTVGAQPVGSQSFKCTYTSAGETICSIYLGENACAHCPSNGICVPGNKCP